MKHLVLIRHGKSSWANSELDDIERPLKKKGIRQAKALQSLFPGLPLDAPAIFSSPAQRAQQTATEAFEQNPSARWTTEESLYTFSKTDLLQWLKGIREAHEVVIVGHNPALMELANHLLPEPVSHLPTGALIHITLPGTSWRQVASQTGTLETFARPEDLDYRLFLKKQGGRQAPEGGSLGERAKYALQNQYRLFRALETGTIIGADSEFLHQYRVNLRRTRAIVEVVTKLGKDKALKQAAEVLKKNHQQTSQCRDLDVFMETLAKWRTDSDKSPLLAALPGMEQWFWNWRTDSHHQIAAHLKDPDYHHGMQQWEALLESKTLDKALGELTSKNLRKRLKKQVKKHNKRSERLDDFAPDDDFHSVRKALKRVRYLVELDPQHLEHSVKGLKKRQKAFGNFQDLHVQMVFLDTYAQHLTDAREQQALSQLMQTLRAEKYHLRHELQTLGKLTLADRG